MIEIHSISDLELLRETVDLECKLAVGRDGQGALPEDFGPTYSAFANTEGGVVVLGMREKQGRFQVEGIRNVAKVRKELFDGANNRQKASVNLLVDADGAHLRIVAPPHHSSRKENSRRLKAVLQTGTDRVCSSAFRRIDRVQ